MEIEIKKKNNCIIDVYFSGEYYLFCDRFAGIFAVAQRTQNEGTKQGFILSYGNSHYNAMTLDAVIRYIKKNECKYIEVETTFNVNTVNCNNKFTFTLQVNNI